MYESGLKFGLGNEIDALRDTVSRFARDRVAPRAAAIDRDNEFPRDLWPEMGKLGLLGITAEEEYGGGAMMLAYSARESTKDLDVTAKPSDSALRLAGVVAQRLGLNEGWLNSDVSRFVSIVGTFAPLEPG